MADKQKRREYNVSPEEFIRVWESSETSDEVAKRLKMPKPIVNARAAGYRKNGVRLKKMRRGSNKGLDVDRLNRIIEKINGTLDEDDAPPIMEVDSRTARKVIGGVVDSVRNRKKANQK